ncbi:MAG: hypothetical protein ABIU97_04100 [Dehalococcoidia bacterium]
MDQDNPLPRRLTRRRLLGLAAASSISATTGVILPPAEGVESARASDARKTSSHTAAARHRTAHIDAEFLQRCARCHRFCGTVSERYNGRIAVRCGCRRKRRDPVGVATHTYLISNDFDRVNWRPISDFWTEDGIRLHVPWFACYRLNSPGHGEPLRSTKKGPRTR